MTTFGHALVGTSMALMCMPGYRHPLARWAFIGYFIALANLPDWPITGWGHQMPAVSHSLFVFMGVAVCMTALWAWFGTRLPNSYRSIMVWSAVAWFSHLMMDAFYANSAVAIFWPLSQAAISIPIPWLFTMPHVPPPFDRQILQIFLLEGLTFSPLIAVATIYRRRKRR